MTNGKDFLQSIRRVLQDVDALAREKKCPKCGKPTGGIVPAGKTKEDVGLCTCDDEKTIIVNP